MGMAVGCGSSEGSCECLQRHRSHWFGTNILLVSAWTSRGCKEKYPQRKTRTFTLKGRRSRGTVYNLDVLCTQMLRMSNTYGTLSHTYAAQEKGIVHKEVRASRIQSNLE